MNAFGMLIRPSSRFAFLHRHCCRQGHARPRPAWRLGDRRDGAVLRGVAVFCARLGNVDAHGCCRHRLQRRPCAQSGAAVGADNILDARRRDPDASGRGAREAPGGILRRHRGVREAGGIEGVAYMRSALTRKSAAFLSIDDERIAKGASPQRQSCLDGTGNAMATAARCHCVTFGTDGSSQTFAHEVSTLSGNSGGIQRRIP